MNLKLSFQYSLRNLLSARLRSILAILGILVGTGSVVALLYSGNMAAEHALAQFKSLGTNIIAVSVSSNSQKKNDQTRQLVLSDIPIIKAASQSIDSIAPYSSSYARIPLQEKTLSKQMIGVTSTFPTVMKTHLISGRYVNEWDRDNHYTVIGSKLAKKLKAKWHMNVLGKQIQTGKDIYTIVGVLGKWTPSYLVFLNLNDGLMVPLPALLASSSYAKINSLVVRLKPGADIKKTQLKLDYVLHHLYPQKTISFRNPEQVINVIDKQRHTLSLLLTAIAGISLLVGGIGVMNIMLVSVTERRREIGLLMAIGATRRDILSMFLIESILLTLIGGIVGIIAGVTVAMVIATFSHWELMFYASPVVLGFLVSTGVGILSGFYPALRASGLDPIKVLHAE